MPAETVIQQKAVLSELRKGPRTTMELRGLNILSPAPRILELRAMGFEIDTEWAYYDDPDGVEHRVAEYHLLPSSSLNKKGMSLLASTNISGGQHHAD